VSNGEVQNRHYNRVEDTIAPRVGGACPSPNVDSSKQSYNHPV
jgi:hypothetical protein